MLLVDLLDEPRLREWAGDNSFRRGQDYHRRGVVGRFTAQGDRLTAEVRGTRVYRAKIWLAPAEGKPGAKPRPAYDCTCPVGRDGAFCKHLVALGLRFLHGKPEDAFSPRTTRADVRQHLLGLEKAALADLLLGAAESDDALSRRLYLLAGLGGSPPAKGKGKTRRGTAAETRPDPTALRHFLRTTPGLFLHRAGVGVEQVWGPGEDLGVAVFDGVGLQGDLGSVQGSGSFVLDQISFGPLTLDDGEGEILVEHAEAEALNEEFEAIRQVGVEDLGDESRQHGNGASPGGHLTL